MTIDRIAIETINAAILDLQKQIDELRRMIQLLRETVREKK